MDMVTVTKMAKRFTLLTLTVIIIHVMSLFSGQMANKPHVAQSTVNRQN